MIINGGARRNAQFFAKHLVKAEENERVTLCEIRNLAAQNVPEAFREMEAIAIGTRCENYFYHANINPLSMETLTEAQWSRAVDLLEENLCLIGHARFIVEHAKKGRVHRHAVWLRMFRQVSSASSISGNQRLSCFSLHHGAQDRRESR